MTNDNTTPITAKEYDKKINATIPYLQEFYTQTMDVIEQCGFSKFTWMDLGCGTGTLEELALQRFKDVTFTLVDPSEKMLEQAKAKLKNPHITYQCATSCDITYLDSFHVITAIQSHHYMKENEREIATQNIYRALKSGGVYITFENVIPEDDSIKAMELLRWGRYQQSHGKTAEEVRLHNARCGVNYFPITVQQHTDLLKNTGFHRVHVFWYSYMQMGIYGMKL
ncbi:MAG: class I SAM-dependent methyltransferase [Clostridiales bacterium]|nr:class I SAM-dependent methyltransferase [Clostridiales bacterium]